MKKKTFDFGAQALLSYYEDRRGQGLPWTSGQGTIEYLVIIGIVVVLALVVVGILVSQTDSANNVSDSSDKINSLVGSNGLAITEAAASLDGEIVLVFVNNSGDGIVLTNVTALDSLGAEGTSNTFSTQILSGDKKPIVLAYADPNCSCGEQEKIICNYKIVYTSSQGLEKAQIIKTPVECLGSASISNPNNQVLSLDTNAPVVTLVTPTDGNETASTSVSFSYSVSDDRNVASCSLLIAGVVDQTDSNAPFDSFTKTIPTTDEADYNWSVSCTDSASNVSLASYRILTYNSPYSISTCLELQNMKNDYNGTYELTGNIDCSDTVNWNSGAGFQPVGAEPSCTDGRCSDIDSCQADYGCASTWFATASCGDASYICDWDSGICESDCGGTFDWDNWYCVDPTASITCATSADYCSWCGYSWFDANTCAYDSTCTTQETCERATGCASTWNSTAFTGNLEGNGYTINDLYVNISGRAGLFGFVDGSTISNINFSDSNINGSSGGGTGTVVGYFASGTLTDINATGEVNGSSIVGGLIGYQNAGNLINGSFTGEVNSAGSYAGGIIGYKASGGDTNNCSFSGNVTATSYAGGIAATAFGLIYNGTASGTVVGTSSNIGGIVGTLNGSSSIQNTTFIGDVNGASSTGGFAGGNSGTISHSSFSGVVNGGSYVGGFVGSNGGTLHRVGATANVYATGNNVGGLVGSNSGALIEESFADTNVISTYAGSWGYISGFVGFNNTSGDINRCYSLGSVKGSSSYNGGFIGENYNGKISDSYSRASIATGSTAGAGFAGRQNSGTTKAMARTYSTGRVNVGTYGFVSLTYGTISQSYFDTNTSTKTSGPTAIAKTTTQMYQQATYTGWDFTNVWEAHEGTGYPTLRWQTE